MSFSITIPENRSYVQIKVNGKLTRQLALQFRKEAEMQGTRLNIQKYLIDVREARNIEPAGLNYYYATTEIKAAGFSKSFATAMLVNYIDASHDLVIKSLKKAGFNVEKFTEEEAAINWLENTN